MAAAAPEGSCREGKDRAVQRDEFDQVNLPFITADANGPKHLDLNMTRAEVRCADRGSGQRTDGPLQAGLSDARPDARSDLKKVMLVGGSTRIPAVYDA